MSSFGLSPSTSGSRSQTISPQIPASHAAISIAASPSSSSQIP